MRILMIVDAVFEDLAGGSRLAARELARGLAQRGHEVVFLAARQPARPGAPAHLPPDNEVQEFSSSGGIRIVRYSGAGRFLDFARSGRKAAAALQRERPFDIAHTHFAYAALGPLLAIKRETPRVRTFHGPWDEEGWIEDVSAATGARSWLKARLKRFLRRRIESASLRGSAAIIVLSEYFRQAAAQRYGIDRQRTHKIVGGVDSDRFAPAGDIARVRVRESLGLPAESKSVILTIRRLAARMGIENLIDAMPELLAQRPDALLLIGGSGPERERLEARVAELGLERYVRLLGFIPDDRLAAHYQAADVFALPTMALEGFGLVTVESLSSGTPVVGTPVGATPEIIGAIPGCVVCSGVAPDALTEGLLSALAQKESRAAMAGAESASMPMPIPLSPQELHEYVKEHYSWSSHVEKTEQLYRAVVRAKQKARGAGAGAASAPTAADAAS